jgi:hypothetical protein
MQKMTSEITRLIHDNFWIVLSFAFAQPAISKILEQRFKGEWKYLHKSIETAEVRADRALLEMATQLRVLDDAEGLNDFFQETRRPPLGRVVQFDGTTTELHFRDMTNKLIHGTKYEWQLGGDDPSIIVHSKQPERWQSLKSRWWH